jgi:hypothetical protein
MVGLAEEVSSSRGHSEFSVGWKWGQSTNLWFLTHSFDFNCGMNWFCNGAIPCNKKNINLAGVDCLPLINKIINHIDLVG